MLGRWSDFPEKTHPRVCFGSKGGNQVVFLVHNSPQVCIHGKARWFLWQKGCFCWCPLVLLGCIPARSVRGFLVQGGFFFGIDHEASATRALMYIPKFSKEIANHARRESVCLFVAAVFFFQEHQS